MRPLLHRGAEPIAKRRLWGRQRMESTHLRSTAAAYMHSGVAMPDMIIPAEQCQTMKDVRIGVDTVDRELVALLARRFAYMRAAARIKPNREMVRDEPRKTEVIANAQAEAIRLGVPAELVGEIWDRLVEGSIAYEMDAFDRRTQHQAARKGAVEGKSVAVRVVPGGRGV